MQSKLRVFVAAVVMAGVAAISVPASVEAGWYQNNVFNDLYGSGRNYTVPGYTNPDPVYTNPAPTNLGPNLVVNGGFEQPVVSANGWQVYANGTSGLGWTMNFTNPEAHRYFCTNPRLEIQREVNGWRAFEGSQYAELDSDCYTSDAGGYIYDSLVDMSQTIATQAGATYKVSFTFGARPGTGIDDNRLTTYFGGQKVSELVADGQALENEIIWQSYSYYVTASSDMTELRFSPRGSLGNSLGVFVDNVNVQKVR